MKILPWVFLLIIVSILHPFVDAGSDSDDAIEIGVSEIIQGRNPYKAHTHLRNPLTPLPGWILLNTPSVFLGAHIYGAWFGYFYVAEINRYNFRLL
jgi:hypothetical protein